MRGLIWLCVLGSDFWILVLLWKHTHTAPCAELLSSVMHVRRWPCVLPETVADVFEYPCGDQENAAFSPNALKNVAVYHDGANLLDIQSV